MVYSGAPARTQVFRENSAAGSVYAVSVTICCRAPCQAKKKNVCLYNVATKHYTYRYARTVVIIRVRFSVFVFTRPLSYRVRVWSRAQIHSGSNGRLYPPHLKV